MAGIQSSSLHVMDLSTAMVMEDRSQMYKRPRPHKSAVACDFCRTKKIKCRDRSRGNDRKQVRCDELTINVLMQVTVASRAPIARHASQALFRRMSLF